MREVETSRYKLKLYKASPSSHLMLLKLCEIIMPFFRTQFSCVIVIVYCNVCFSWSWIYLIVL
jgi:hypothetical protein